ncbi:hypothetical protein BGX23_000176 [Mortierella sp. AD031]|nr:hypothetical protein BGX23_000176 [Mortierella sp. AD031]
MSTITNSRISIFDIPHILDLICDHLSQEQLLHCRQVSRPWYDLFHPQALRNVRFVNLKKHQTWEILDRAARIRSLTVDISDAGWFLNNPTPCFNLQELHCVDFDYQPKPAVANLSGESPSIVDQAQNALLMIQTSPRLHTLSVQYDDWKCKADHFTEPVFKSLSTHKALAQVKIHIPYIPLYFLDNLSNNLPTGLRDLEFLYHSTVRMRGDVEPSPPLVFTTTVLPALKRLCLRGPTQRVASHWPETFIASPFSPPHQQLEALYDDDATIALVRRSPRLRDLTVRGHYGRLRSLMQVMVDSCPDLETIELTTEDYYMVHDDNDGDDEPSVLTGSFAHLKEFRIVGVWSELVHAMIAGLIVRSSATLEVVWFENSTWEGSESPNPFHIGTETSWTSCTRLKEVVFGVRGGSLMSDYCWNPPSSSSHMGKEEQEEDCSLVFGQMERLRLTVKEPLWQECSDGYHTGGYFFFGGGDDDAYGDDEYDETEQAVPPEIPPRSIEDDIRDRKAKRQEQQTERDHQLSFILQVREIYGRIKDLKRLKDLDIEWNACSTIRNMTLGQVLELFYETEYDEEEAHGIKLKRRDDFARTRKGWWGKMTRADLCWLGLSWPSQSELKQQADVNQLSQMVYMEATSSLWHNLFQPQLIRHVRFADLKKKKTWDILDHANRIQSLEIDIADGGWFLDNPATTKTTMPCINLKELRCVDFGYFTDPASAQPDNPDYQWQLALMNKSPRHVSAGVKTNALGLVEQNSKLRTLIIEHQRRSYGVDHFTPQVLQSFSTHPSLARLQIDLKFEISIDFLAALFQHLPPHLQDLSICVNEFARSTTTASHQVSAAQPRASTTPSPQTDLRKLCLRTSNSGPASSWEEEDSRPTWEYYFQDDCYPDWMVLPLIRQSPQLQELILGSYQGLARTLVQTLFDFCPDLEVLDLGGTDSSHLLQHQLNTADEDIAPTLTGTLPKLKSFRLRGETKGWSASSEEALSEIIARSVEILEVLWLEVSDPCQGWVALNPFCMRDAGEENRKALFPRLKELVVHTGKGWVYPDIVDRPHNNDDEDGNGVDDQGVHGSGLGGQNFPIRFPVLERLSLLIRDAAPEDCRGCNGSLGPGRKDPTQKELLQRRREQKQESHRRQFATRLRQLFSSLSLRPHLEKLALRWDLCETIQKMTLDDLLALLNDGKHPEGEPVNNLDHYDPFHFHQNRHLYQRHPFHHHLHYHHALDDLRLGSFYMKVEDIDWLDLLFLPTRACIERRMTAKAAAVQRKEWESEVWQTVQDGLSINRYSDPSDPLYQRVGHGWQDWESLVGKCRCVFQKEMTSRYFETDHSNCWKVCPHDAFVSRELECLVLRTRI